MNDQAANLNNETDSYRALKVFGRAEEARSIKISRSEIVDAKTDETVRIRVAYSGLNFKDALAVTGRGNILRTFPLVAGIDAAGTIEASPSSAFKIGQKVVLTGGGMGESFDGGFAETLSVPAGLPVALPRDLSLSESMLLGTAGFSAAMALMRMEQNGQRPELGPIVVTGASGGVGGWAVQIFSAAGYEVIAVSGKQSSRARLLEMGARKIETPETLGLAARELGRGFIGGVVDTVGGSLLPKLIAHVVPWGNVTSIGMAGGANFESSVMPFILRGVSLIGISSTNAPQKVRAEIWARLGSDLRPKHFELMRAHEISLSEVVTTAHRLLDRQIEGRVVVRVLGES